MNQPADGPVRPAPQDRPGRLGVGVIGAGKVGAVLGAALRNAGHAVTGVHAVSEASRTRAESLLPEVPILEIPEILRRSEVILFAVPDDTLPGLVSGLAEAGHFQTGHLVVHTSGRHGITVLDPVRAAGAIPLAIHPAMSFTGLTLDLARLQDCMFGVTADAVVLPVAQALVVEMGGEPAVIREQDRGTYHAALSHASNHLVTLTAQSAQLLASIGVEQTDRMLAPLMSASLENALSNGDAALTGPVARGDVGTVRRHLEVLDALAGGAEDIGGTEGALNGGIPADVGQAYRAMARATAQRALARGALSEAVVAELLDVLGG